MAEQSWDAAEAQASVVAPPAEVADLFWNIRAWHAIWLKIDDVEVLYEDPVHQEFVMGVERDGRREDVRTIRFRQSGGDINFFSPRPPPTMTSHRGSWRFRADPAIVSACRVLARREYELRRNAHESEADFQQRRLDYRQQLAARLQAILNGFAGHFAAARPESQQDGTVTTCTERIVIHCSPESAGSFLRNIHNLPTWTGFFRSIGAPVGDRYEVTTAMGTKIQTRVEPDGTGGYAISSIVGEREERAEVAVTPVPVGVEVSFTVRMRAALADHVSRDPGSAPSTTADIQRARMREELDRLRSALSAG